MSAFLKTKEFVTGFLYTLIGGLVAFLAGDYEFGSLSRIGSGFMPMVLGLILAGIGLACIVWSALRPGEQVTGVAWRPLILIVSSIIGFGMALPFLGLPVALVILIVQGSMASTLTRYDAKYIIGLLLFIAVVIAVFIYGLGLPIPLVGSLFR